MRHYVNVLEGHTFVNISGSTLFNITPTPPSNKETGFASYLLIEGLSAQTCLVQKTYFCDNNTVDIFDM